MVGPEPVAMRRVFGVGSLTLAVINFIIGSAIFVVPATVAGQLGSAAIAAYLLAGMLVLTVALCFAEVASRVTATGGPYAYVQRAFGPWAGFVTGSLQWLANGVVAAAAVANALADTVATLFPGVAGGAFRIALLTAVFGTLIAINVRGVGQGAAAVVVLTILKLVPLGLLLVAGLHLVDPGNLAWSGAPPLDALGSASLLLIFALTGAESALAPTGEIRNPSRTVPIATVLGVGLAVTIYVVIHLLAQGILGPALARSTAAPLADVAERVFGSGGRLLLLIGAAVSMTGFLSGDALATPRSFFALASDGLLPRFLSRIHPRFATPHLAVISYGTLCWAFAVAGSFTALALLNAIGVLVIYLGVALATFKLRRDGVEADRPPVRLPGGPLIPIVATGLIVVLMANSPWQQLAAAGGFVVVATAIYLVIRKRS